MDLSTREGSQIPSKRDTNEEEEEGTGISGADWDGVHAGGEHPGMSLGFSSMFRCGRQSSPRQERHNKEDGEMEVLVGHESGVPMTGLCVRSGSAVSAAESMSSCEQDEVEGRLKKNMEEMKALLDTTLASLQLLDDSRSRQRRKREHHVRQRPEEPSTPIPVPARSQEAHEREGGLPQTPSHPITHEHCLAAFGLPCKLVNTSDLPCCVCIYRKQILDLAESMVPGHERKVSIGSEELKRRLDRATSELNQKLVSLKTQMQQATLEAKHSTRNRYQQTSAPDEPEDENNSGLQNSCRSSLRTSMAIGMSDDRFVMTGGPNMNGTDLETPEEYLSSAIERIQMMRDTIKSTAMTQSQVVALVESLTEAINSKGSGIGPPTLSGTQPVMDMDPWPLSPVVMMPPAMGLSHIVGPISLGDSMFPQQDDA